jgi:hypothetical protein
MYTATTKSNNYRAKFSETESDFIRPGPLSTSYLDIYDKPPCVQYAQDFINRCVYSLSGYKHVVIESNRIFARFDVENSQVLDVDNSAFVDALSKIWFIGDGFICIRQNSDQLHKDHFPIAYVYVYEITRNSYKLVPVDMAKQMVNVDPLWEYERKNLKLKFIEDK